MAKDLISREDRICFKYDYGPDDTIEALIPVKQSDGEFADIRDWDRKDVTKKDILEALWTMDIMSAKTPSFDLLINKHFPIPGKTKGDLRRCEICPVGLMSEDTRLMIAIEAMCEKYGTLPYEPGTSLESQPSWIVDSFLTISVAKDKYYQRKAELDRIKAKKGSK